jgi:NADH dehydrogenase
MPTVERKIRVIFGWILAFFMGRDTTQLIDLDNPRGAFVAAATPAPKPAAAPVAAPAAPEASAGAAKPGSAAATSVDPKQSVTADAK